MAERLIGSLSALPYALAEAEKDFLVPSQTQALIWGDLVPQMILSATLPRYWNVTPVQMRWVAASMRHAEAMIAEGLVRSTPSACEAGFSRAVGNAASLIRYDSRWHEEVAGGNGPRGGESADTIRLYLIGQNLSASESDPDPGALELTHLRAVAADQVSAEAISRVCGHIKGLR